MDWPRPEVRPASSGPLRGRAATTGQQQPASEAGAGPENSPCPAPLSSPLLARVAASGGPARGRAA
eukprot:13115350-Alexandrium_andersonii.AAC.1